MAVRPPQELDVHTLQQTGLECACFNLRKAARAVTQLYDDALRPAGVLATQLPLLAATGRLERATVTERETCGGSKASKLAERYTKRAYPPRPHRRH